MLLHKDASYQTYRAFFSHLCAELEHSVDNIELRLHESIEFGSDDERAITKAIENSFGLWFLFVLLSGFCIQVLQRKRFLN
jgi:hypothetical protein